jgi:hypothetical protein
MRLTPNQSRELLSRFGAYVTEACDRCGQLLSAVRFTRRGDAGVWCSRECRGDGERRAIRKTGRPRKYENGDERRTAKTRQQRNYRLRPSVEKTVCIQSETKDLQAQKWPLSYYPLNGPVSLWKQPSGERGVG